MSEQELLEDYSTPEKRANALKTLIVEAIIELHNLHVMSVQLKLPQDVIISIQQQIDTIRERYFQITRENLELTSRVNTQATHAQPREMHGGRRRLRESSVQRRKHHSNKKGKTVRHKMTRTCARRSRR
jgi:hypothetical protein